MLELLSYPFMVKALIAALLTGMIAPSIGTYIVQRRLSLLGDGLGHVAIAGVGLALMTRQAPIPVAVVVCVAGAVVVEVLRQRGKATGDVGLAILFYGGLAAGVLMSTVAGAGAGALSQYLFGSLVSVSSSDLKIIAILAVVVMVPAIGLAPRLFAVCADEDFAKVLGLKVPALNLLIVILAALTVTISMRTVGLLLVSALMVVPVAAAQNLVRGFSVALFTAIGLGVLASVGGATASYYLNAAPGATIVVLAIVIFALTWPIGALVRRRRRAGLTPEPVSVEPLNAEHPHVHGGPNCAHVAVPHEDHLDYLHDGHRHAPHGDHYDEHEPRTSP